MEIKINKTEKLLEVNNDMVHNFYFLIKGRMYNDSKTESKKFKFVIWFDIFDVLEYFESESISESDLYNYLNDLIACNLDQIKSYNDCQDFYNTCHQSINNFNKGNLYIFA